MKKLLYAVKVFKSIPKNNGFNVKETIGFNLAEDFRCVLVKQGEHLKITLNLLDCGVDSSRDIDLTQGKFYTFKEILAHLRTIH